MKNVVEYIIEVLFWVFILTVAIFVICTFASIMSNSEVGKSKTTRSMVINELCQKQQYDFCNVKEVIYMENDDDQK